MKKIWLNIKLLWHYLFAGMASADAKITSGEKTSSDGNAFGIEQKKEVDNVYAQMLRGEVTEEVKELRYEMYQADRKSHEYAYTGGGHASKINIFGFDGGAMNDDGLEIELVQENDVIPISLTDYGIVSNGTQVMYDDTKDNDPDRLHDGNTRIQIKYDYNPRFKIENFAKKIVVKKVADPEKRKIDLYFWSQPNQFERISRLFTNYISGVYNMTEKPSEFDFSTISFVSYRAYGTDASKLYAYGNPKYCGISLFDGSYVVSFMVDVIDNGSDMLDDVYHKATAEKIERNEARKSATISLVDAAEAVKEPCVTKEEADEIFEETGDGQE